MDKETRDRLRVLWVLLNVSTETETTDESCAVMRAIEKKDKSAMKLWDSGFSIVSKGKTLFEWPSESAAYARNRTAGKSRRQGGPTPR